MLITSVECRGSGNRVGKQVSGLRGQICILLRNLNLNTPLLRVLDQSPIDSFAGFR